MAHTRSTTYPKPRRRIVAPLILTTLISAMNLPVAVSCPFCLTPPRTWSQSISDADIVILAQLVQVETFQDKSTPETTFRVLHVRRPAVEQKRVLQLSRAPLSRAPLSLKSSPNALALQSRVHSDVPANHDLSVAGSILLMKEFVTGIPGDLFILVGHRIRPASSDNRFTFQSGDDDIESPQTAVVNAGGGPLNGGDVQTVSASTELNTTANESIFHLLLNESSPDHRLQTELIEWEAPSAVSQATALYILNAPDGQIPASLRLPYYVRFLESNDAEIAGDAWAEFARSDYEDVKAVRSLLSSDDLKAWIADDQMSPERLGLYGMMLGLCGTAEDVEFLRDTIGEPRSDSEFRFGTEGLMGGLMLLQGREGLEYLNESRMTNSHASLSELSAAMQAIRFIYSYEPGHLDSELLMASLRNLLGNPSMRELALTDLTRWKDWSIAQRLSDMFDYANDDPGSQRAILIYMTMLQKDAATGSESAVAQCPIADALIEHVKRVAPELLQSPVRNAVFR
ncbi:MAG: hypothetical protein R3C20_08665 [Planctomycetaceae bacterium]